MSTLKKCITLSSQVSKIDDAVSELVDFVLGLTRIEDFTLSIALTEAITNAIIHGNEKDPAKSVFAQVLIEPERVVFQQKKKIFLNKAVEVFFFVRYFMDEIKFNNVGNEITMVKYAK